MRRLVIVVGLAAFGVWMVVALLDSRRQHGLTTDALTTAAMVIGAAVLTPIPYALGLGERLAARNAEFWSLPRGVVSVAIWWSLGACLGLGWIVLVLILSGSSIGGP
jgi:hypothetical protein